MSAAFRLWIGGQGGQGVSFLAALLCQAIQMEQGSVWSRTDPEWAIRGGRMVASVLADPDPFSLSDVPDYNWQLYLHPSLRELTPPCASDVQILDAYELEAYRFSEAAGFPLGLNMVMLGILLQASQICQPDTLVWQLRRMLREQVSVLPYNLDLFEKGLELGATYAGHS